MTALSPLPSIVDFQPVKSEGSRGFYLRPRAHRVARWPLAGADGCLKLALNQCTMRPYLCSHFKNYMF